MIFTSDNGGPNYITIRDINHPLRGWKATLLEGGLRVPLFMQWTDQISSGLIDDSVVSHIDILPTLIDAINSKEKHPISIEKNIENAVEGASLMPSLTSLKIDNTTNISRYHDSLFWRSGHYKAIRKGDWKASVSTRPKKKWLFNLHDDPSEINNLADKLDYQSKLNEMTELIEAYDQNYSNSRWQSVSETAVFFDKLLGETEHVEDEFVYWPN